MDGWGRRRKGGVRGKVRGWERYGRDVRWSRGRQLNIEEPTIDKWTRGGVGRGRAEREWWRRSDRA